MARIRLATPPFSSPDPETSKRRKHVHLDDAPAEAAAAPKESVGDGYDGMKAPELKKMVKDRGLQAEGNKKDDFIKALRHADAENESASSLVEQVNAAETQEQLDALAAVYAETGSDWKTVEDAIEAKQNEINQQGQ